VAERGRTVESVLDQYLATVRPMHEQYVASGRSCAQLVLSGEDDPQQNIRRVLTQLPAHICPLPGSSQVK
jgi:uridine kinase